MTINIVQLLAIIIFTGLAYWANEKINNVPKLKEIVSVLVVVVGVVLVVTSLIGKFSTHITIN